MTENNKTNAVPTPTERKPNESSGFHFSTAIKITDPNTKEVLLHKRAD